MVERRCQQPPERILTGPVPDWMAWLTNLYCYQDIVKETEKGIVLNLITDEGLKRAPLPKKCVTVYRHLNEVEIPDWLCAKLGLI